MLEYDTQKELLKETVSPTKAPEIATLMEMGSQNQQKINQFLNTNAHSVNIVNNFQGRNRTTNYQQQRKHFPRHPSVPKNYQYTSIYGNCGQS